MDRFHLFGVSDAKIYGASCSLDSLLCTLTPLTTHSIGTPQTVASYAPGNGTSPVAYLWISGSAGTAAFTLTSDGKGGAQLTQSFSSPAIYPAIAFSNANNELALGNETAVVYLNPTHPFAFQYFDWVTDMATASGAPIDDAVTSLQYASWPGSDKEVLYAGNPTCLNVRLPDSLTWLRLAGGEGLPYSNITSLALDDRRGERIPGQAPGAVRPTPRLWLGTDAGAILYDPLATSEQGLDALETTGTGTGSAGGERVSFLPAGVSSYRQRPRGKGTRGSPARELKRVRSHAMRGAPASIRNGESAAAGVASSPAVFPLSQTWRYFFGPRYMPSTPSTVFTGRVVSNGIVSLGNTTYILTTTGIALLTAYSSTLADKAARMEALLPRHDRLGMIAECYYGSFGVGSPCTPGPSANNGLWTSLIVNAMAFKYAVTGAEADREAAWHYLTGMQLLNTVTGIKGLIARSAVAPGTPFPGQDWHNSTSMPGYAWYGTASSDEVAGHVFAYPVMSQLGVPSTNTSARAIVEGLLTDLAVYIVENNFTLVDVTGQPTRWGHWDPATINGNRLWSDGRGINSLEVMALTTSAMAYLDSNTAGYSLLRNGRDELITQYGYLRNMLNARINTPIDDNYSDDELEWFSYFSLLYTVNATGNEAYTQELINAAQTSIQRSWDTGVSVQRASVWGAMYIVMTSPTFPAPLGPAAASDPAVLSIAQDIMWNLRTWATELTDWPAQNSHRLDIMIDPALDRFGQVEGLRVLPHNERYQGRWNADPFDLDGGSGMQEDDPGAWLLPYWLSRYYGIISA